MSSEGVAFIARAGLVILLIIVGAFVRVFVGPGRKRGYIVLAGTLGGITAGLLAEHRISVWFGHDVSTLSAVGGVMLGCAVSCWFARHVPWQAN